MNRPEVFSEVAEPDLTRRQLLVGLGSGATTIAAGKAIDNALLGFGVVTGTNLREQNLTAIARKRFEPSAFTTTVSGYRLRFRDNEIHVHDSETRRTLSLPASPEEAAVLDAEFGLGGGPLEQLIRDFSAIDAGAFRFEFSQYEQFFDRLQSADARPFTVEAFRSNRVRNVEPAAVESFAGAPPANPKATLEGLVDGFREYTEYDLPRYIVGSIEDNVIFGAMDLRRHFESPTTFEALESGKTDGMFCFEFTWRAIEALHSVSAGRQQPPVLGATVYDDRHGHTYVGVASVVREEGDLVVPMTFVDYRNSTLYDDFHLREILPGEGLAAYDRCYRASDIYW
ncbi:hypothetical protein [Haladaptatus sp. NG-SE-30]